MQKKRGQNEGTIFEEKPGRWVASLSLGYKIVDGKRRRIRKKFVAPTRKTVQEKLNTALREQQTGGQIPLQKGSFGDFLKAWLPTLVSKGRTEKTVQSYTWLVEKHIVPEIGIVPLTKLTQSMLNDYMQRKLNCGLSARTVQYCHAIIRSALSKAERDGLVGRNVAKLAEPPAKDKRNEIEPLSAEEARRVLAAVEGHCLEALYAVALAVGLRKGEVIGLQWSSLDLKEGTLKVIQTTQRIKGKGMVTRRAGKSDASIRMIPLPRFAIAVLQRHLDRQKVEKEFAGEKWKECGLVFPSSVGTPLEPRNLTRHFHSVLEQLKIDRRRIHDLRHTAASLLLAQGATLHDVKEILGHSQISLTANLYGHAYTSVLRETVDLVGSVLAPQVSVAPSVAPSSRNRKPN